MLSIFLWRGFISTHRITEATNISYISGQCGFDCVITVNVGRPGNQTPSLSCCCLRCRCVWDTLFAYTDLYRSISSPTKTHTPHVKNMGKGEINRCLYSAFHLTSGFFDLIRNSFLSFFLSFLLSSFLSSCRLVALCAHQPSDIHQLPDEVRTAPQTVTNAFH